MGKTAILILALILSACGVEGAEVGLTRGERPTPTAIQSPTAVPPAPAEPTVVDTSAIATFVPDLPATQPPRALDPTGSEEMRLAAVQASVPNGVELAFEWQSYSLKDGEYDVRALAPVGWKASGDGDREFDSAAFGFWTQLELSAGCQGFCERQDWSNIMADSSNSPFAYFGSRDEIEVLVDQELVDPSGRLLVFETSNPSFAKVFIRRVSWSNDADRYFSCEVTLDADDYDLWPAFADMCLAAEVIWL